MLIALVKFLFFVPVWYLTFYSIYWLVTILIGTFHNPKKTGPLSLLLQFVARRQSLVVSESINPETLLILPAYKPGKIFFKVLESLEVAIKNRNVKVYILFQEADSEFIEEAQKYGFLHDENKFSHLPGNSYHHALHFIIQKIDDFRKRKIWNPEFVMLVDKDNIIAPDFFECISPEDYIKYDVIQARRTAMNENGAVSFFDTVSEGLNDTMFRAAKSILNGTVEISGSGALIRTSIFVAAIANLDGNAPGYDKNFMVQILTGSTNVSTVYLPYLQLFEEKTSDIDAYNPQRIRWFGEQYYNAIFSAKKLISAFVKYGRLSALEYLLVLWRPPRSFQILAVPIFAVVEYGYFLFRGAWLLDFPYMTLSAVFLSVASIIFLWKEKLLKRSVKHAFELPNLAYQNMKNASNSIKKENRGKFIHTEHKM